MLSVWDTGKDTERTTQEAFVEHLPYASVAQPQAPRVWDKHVNIDERLRTVPSRGSCGWTLQLDSLILETRSWKSYPTSLSLYMD